MKKLILFSALMSASLLSFADTIHYVGDWATSFGDTVNWKEKVSPSASDDAVLDYFNEFVKTIVEEKNFDYSSTIVRADTTLKSLTVKNLYRIANESRKSMNLEVRFSQGATNKTFEILGDLQFYRSESGGNLYFGKIEGEASETNRNQAIIKIGGNILLGDRISEPYTETGSALAGSIYFGTGSSVKNKYNGSPLKLYVDGNIDIFGTEKSRFYTDVGSDSRVFGDISNPDIIVKGIVSMEDASKYNYPTWTINNRSDANALNTVVQIGGLGYYDSDAKRQNGNVNMTKAASGMNTTTLIFTNAAGEKLTYIGRFYDTTINETTGAISNSGKIKVIMNGEGTQVLRPNYMPEYAIFTGGAQILKGTLLIANVDIAEISADKTLVPVGDVQLHGGRIGAIGKDGSAIGSFYANKLLWGGKGKILIDVNAQTSDLITFKGGLFKDAIEGSLDEYAFEFTDLSSVIDGKVYKIVSFIGNTDFIASDFISNAQDFDKSAEFSMDANNIYVTFATIPEASFYASILAFFALFIGIWRRQK